MGVVASVAIDKSTNVFDKLYDYYVPKELVECCFAGCRVVVPFGNSNGKRQGFVISLKETDECENLKNIFSVIDETPLLNDEMIKLIFWIKEHYFCTFYDAVHALLPAGLNFKIIEKYTVLKGDFENLNNTEKLIYDFLINQKSAKTSTQIAEAVGFDCEKTIKSLVRKGILTEQSESVRKVGDASVKMLRLCEPDGEISVKLTPKQKSVVNLLIDVGAMSYKEICYFTGVGTTILNNLVKYGVCESFEQEIYRLPESNISINRSDDITLTDEQNKVYKDLLLKTESGEFSTSLLYGITGSGKTQVFLKLVEKVIKSGKGVIVMVPEISLTPQMLDLFYRRFGKKVAVFHSALPLGQRLDEWKRVKNGEALVALGTRSAVFAPFKNLGLIVMDEEQEHTYKSEQSPRFSTKDVARFRAAYHKCLCLLASATPSIESFSAAKSGKYSLYTLKNRYGNAVLPDVTTVDMRHELSNGNNGSISLELAEEIRNTLDNKKQVILLLNRRGHNTYVSCPQCGYVATCKNCSISMTYHSANGRLMCHYCGYSQEYTKKCPVCQSEHLKFSGAGTQKLEDEISEIFPNARVLRLDADTTMHRDAFKDKLNAFANGDYDILVGTQMVAKGLNFPNVTLVGVLSADMTMYSDDYKGYERTFSLLTQVVGRCGRGEYKGKAYIQSFNPDSEVITLASKQDYEAFYNNEILTRKLMIYPPYCDMVAITASGTNQSFVKDASLFFVDLMKKKIDDGYSDVKIIILRPTQSSVFRVNNKYRYRTIIKCKNNKRFRDFLRDVMGEYYSSKFQRAISITVDVNPENNI